MPEKILIGFDPGLAATGYGVISVRGSSVRHLAHGVIRSSPDLPDEERLDIIFKAVTDLLENYGPIRAGVESLYFTKNITSAMPVAQARGVILLGCARAGVEVVNISPPQIKQRITGVGRADKAQVQQMIRLLLGLDKAPESDHAADALAAAYCVWQEPAQELST